MSVFIVAWFGAVLHKHPFHLNGFETAFKRDTEDQKWFLPPEVIEMKRMASKHPTFTYVLSEAFKADDWITQRATEYLYPIRFTPNGKYVFERASKIIPPDCSEIDRQPGVVLYECP